MLLMKLVCNQVSFTSQIKTKKEKKPFEKQKIRLEKNGFEIMSSSDFSPRIPEAKVKTARSVMRDKTPAEYNLI